MRFSSVIGCVLIGFALLGGSAPARADVAPPGAQECDGKAAGDACDGGVCKARTCSKLNYADWDRDAEPAPPTVRYDCLLCEPGAAGEDAGVPAPDSDDGGGCGSCSTGHGDSKFPGVALGFALFMGMWLGKRRRSGTRR
jgi:hypothetical protein